VGLRASSREGTSLKAAPIVVCARTSLAVTPACDDAQTSAMRARYGLTPGRVASSRLGHTSGAKASRSTHRLLAAISGVARVKAGGARVFCRRPAAQVATLMAGVAQWSPVVSTGTRETARARTVAPLQLPLRLHLDVSILRRAQDRYVAKNAFASRPRATDNVAWSLLRTRRSRQA
jgi:hypothetical protein